MLKKLPMSPARKAPCLIFPILIPDSIPYWRQYGIRGRTFFHDARKIVKTLRWVGRVGLNGISRTRGRRDGQRERSGFREGWRRSGSEAAIDSAGAARWRVLFVAVPSVPRFPPLRWAASTRDPRNLVRSRPIYVRATSSPSASIVLPSSPLLQALLLFFAPSCWTMTLFFEALTCPNGPTRSLEADDLAEKIGHI